MIFGTRTVSLVGASLGPPLVFLIGKDLVNILRTRFGSPDHGPVLDSLVGSLPVIALGNLLGYLLRYSSDMLPESLLGTWYGALLGSLPGSIQASTFLLRLVSHTYMYFSWYGLVDMHMTCSHRDSNFWGTGVSCDPPLWRRYHIYNETIIVLQTLGVSHIVALSKPLQKRVST